MKNDDSVSIPFSFIKEVLTRISLKKLLIMIICLVMGQGLYMTLPGLVGFLTDQVVVQNHLHPFYLFLFPLTWLVSIIFSWMGRFYTSILTQDARKESKEILFEHIVLLPNRFFITRDAGELESLMQEISFGTRYIINENVPFFLRSAMTIMVAALVVFQDSLPIAVLFLVWASLYIPISYTLAKKSVKNVSESIVSASMVSASTVEVIQNHELIPAFGTERYEINRFKDVLERERESFNKAQKKIDYSELLLRMIQVLLPFSVVWILLLTKHYQAKTPGALATLFTMTLVFTSQMGDFGKGILSFFEMRERMKTALNRLAGHELQSNQKQNRTAKMENWNIHFENVSFKYDASHLGVQNVNLKINENEKVGLVGFSGAGKTTLLKLLRGILEPEKGSVRLNGCSIDKIDPKSLTKGIAEVSQSIPLFNRSVRENVAYGCDHMTDDRIWDVLERAQIADHIRRLPQGLDTVLGVRGQKFSGGERARIAIARAFIREAQVIILDEAMAAIDSESELLIQKGLEKLTQGRTVIAVAHRLSTLKGIQRIIVMDKGHIIGDGTHQELLLTCPLYQRLWEIQRVI